MKPIRMVANEYLWRSRTMNAIYRTCFFLYFILLGGPVLHAQVDSSGHASLPVIQTQVHIGKIVKIYPTFPGSDETILTELNLSLQTAGKRNWHQLYHFPQVGMALFYGYLGNNAVFGQNIALVPNLTFHKPVGRIFSLEFQFGMGLSYFTKHYDAITNPTNNVIGASITNITYLLLDGSFKLGNHLNLNAGLSAFHCSDGHYQLPNLGANIPSVNLGVSYFPQGRPTLFKKDSIPAPQRKLLFTAGFGYGRHEFGSATKATGGPKYNVFQGMFYLSKRWRKICNLHAGIFVTYYADYYDYIVNQELFDSKQQLRSTIVTLFIGNEFMIGKFGLVVQSGVNVYTPFLKKIYENQPSNPSDGFVIYMSTKLGIQYYLFDPSCSTHRNCFLGIYLKAKSGEADFAQLAAGYTF
jgi:hypothetical protein